MTKDINNNEIKLTPLMLMSILTLMMLLTNNIMIKWFIAEMTSLLMIYYLTMNSNKSIISIYYYMISSLTMIMFTFLILMKLNIIIYSESIIYLFQLLMFLKLSIYPFSYWFVASFEYLTWNQIFLMSTFMKMIPIILFSELSLNMELIIWVTLNNIILSFESMKYSSMKKIFACSSITQNFIFLILIFINKFLFLIYMIMYIILIYLIMNLLVKNKINNKIDLIKFNSYTMIIYKMLIIIYMMLPPMILMMLKWTFMFEVMKIKFMWLFLFIYLLTNLIMLWNYFNLIKIPKIQNPYPMNYNLVFILIFMMLMFICINIVFTMYMNMY